MYELKDIYSTSLHLVFLAIAILVFASYFVGKNNGKGVAILIFAAALLTGYYFATLDDVLNIWDEQFHALVAKNMLENPLHPKLYSEHPIPYDFKSWISNGTWLHKQPLFLWQIALSIKIFGVNTLAVRIPSIVLFALTSVLILRVGKMLLNLRTGWIAASLYVCCFYMLELIGGAGSTDHNDVSFIFYVTASLWALIEYHNNPSRKWILAIGLLSGAAILVKWLVGLLVYGCWGIILIVRNKFQFYKDRDFIPLLQALLVTLIIALPWQLYILYQFPKEAMHEYAYNSLHFSQVIESHGGDGWFHINALTNLYGLRNWKRVLVLCGLICLLVRLKKREYQIIVISAVLLVYVFYSLAATKMLSFTFIVCGFIFIGFGALLDSIFEKMEKYISRRWLRVTISTIVVLLFCVKSFNKSTVIVVHLDKSNRVNERRYNNWKLQQDINHLKSRLPQDNLVLFYPQERLLGNIAMMYYTNWIVYDKLPTIEEVQLLKRNGYTVAVVDSTLVDDAILNDELVWKVNGK